MAETRTKSPLRQRLSSSYQPTPTLALQESCSNLPSYIEIEISVSLSVLHDSQQKESENYAKVNVCDLIRGRQLEKQSRFALSRNESNYEFVRVTDKADLKYPSFSYHHLVKFVCCSTEECRKTAEMFNNDPEGMFTCALSKEKFDSLLPDETSSTGQKTRSTKALNLEAISLMDCGFCPRKSYCIMTDSYTEGWYTRDDVHYFQCLCKEGYTGDGWRCDQINECLENPWPCPPDEQGGYCVDTDPDDEEFPRYKCGCQSGYEIWLSGENGARVCIPEGTASTYVDSPSTQPSMTSLPTFSQVPSPSPSITGGCNLCPTKSLCIEASPGSPDSFQSDADDGKWIRCKCKEGYSGGDGFRCYPTDECAMEDSPCPSEAEGGYCVNRDPEDSIYPRYECGCLHGYDAVSFDGHGATACSLVRVVEDSVLMPTLAPSHSLEPSSSPPTETPLTEFVESLFLNVDGNSADDILAEKELIESIFAETYRALDSNACNCRFLNNVTILGILSDYGFQSATDEYDSTFVRRTLQESSNVLNSTNATNSDSLYEFNFSIWFRFIFSCLGCVGSFFGNDASRRQLRGTNTYLISSIDFMNQFNELLIKKNVKSVEKVVAATQKEPAVYEEYLPKTEQPTPAPTDEIPCTGSCSGDHQKCILGQCKCEDGFFQLSGVGGACTDFKECDRDSTNNCDEATELCVELIGSYKCECKAGYKRQPGGTCEDVNECEDNFDCPSNLICSNTVGSYICVETVESASATLPNNSPTPPTRNPTRSPDRSPTHRPSALPSLSLSPSQSSGSPFTLYAMGEGGGECPSGQAVPQSECLEAANGLRENIVISQEGLNVITWDGLPCGCFFWFNTNDGTAIIDYNTMTTNCNSMGNNNFQMICYASPVPSEVPSVSLAPSKTPSVSLVPSEMPSIRCEGIFPNGVEKLVLSNSYNTDPLSNIEAWNSVVTRISPGYNGSPGAAELTYTSGPGSHYPCIRQHVQYANACLRGGMQLSVSFKAKLLDATTGAGLNCDPATNCPTARFRARQDRPDGTHYCNGWFPIPRPQSGAVTWTVGEWNTVSAIFTIPTTCQGTTWNWFLFDIHQGQAYAAGAVKLQVDRARVILL